MSTSQRIERSTRRTGIPVPGEPSEQPAVDSHEAEHGPAQAPEPIAATAATPAPSDRQATHDRAQRILRLEHTIERAARTEALPLPPSQVQGFLELLLAANSLPAEPRGPLLDRLERFGNELLTPVSRRPADVTHMQARLIRLWSDLGSVAEASRE